MIQDARVLRDDFLPSEVRHRDQEINIISAGLEPITNGNTGEPLLIFGPSGAGKTCIARYALDQLKENALGVTTHYVNCWSHHSTFRVLEQLCDGIGQAYDIHRQSTPTDELLERIRTYEDSPYVVVLDEVDQLDDLAILYDLYSIREVTPILIANEEDPLFARMDNRVVSRFRGAQKITFDKYSIDELVAILSDRVEWGLEPESIDHDGLERIADAAVGDARAAIAILRNTAQEATTRGLDRIGRDLIENAVSAGQTEIKESTLSRLNEHQELLYEIVQEAEEIHATDLYEEYESSIGEPKSRRQVRNYLTKLQHYKLINADGVKRWRKYSVNT